MPVKCNHDAFANIRDHVLSYICHMWIYEFPADILLYLVIIQHTVDLYLTSLYIYWLLAMIIWKLNCKTKNRSCLRLRKNKTTPFGAFLNFGLYEGENSAVYPIRVESWAAALTARFHPQVRRATRCISTFPTGQSTRCCRTCRGGRQRTVPSSSSWRRRRSC